MFTALMIIFFLVALGIGGWLDNQVHRFELGSAGIIEDDLVIIAAEYDGKDSGLYALDARTGKRVWKVPRPENLNFASPIIATIAGQRQILLAGADMMVGYDPQTGREL